MKRLLALLLVSLCLFTLFACTNEPLPEKTAPELIQLAKDKMQTFKSYEIGMTTTQKITNGADVSDSTAKATLRSAANGDRYFKTVTEEKTKGSATKSTIEITVIGEDAYMTIEALGTVQKIKTDAGTASSMEEMPTLEEMLANLSAEEFESATVEAGTNSWTITLSMPMIPDADAIGITNMATTIVISRSYTIRSITVSYDYEQSGITGTMKVTMNFSHLGSARVSAPLNADEYTTME